MTETIVFLHIPKTGGTSLSVALERLWQPHEVFPDRLAIRRNGGDYPAFDRYLGMPAREKAAIRLIRGHFTQACLDEVPQPMRSIVVLRDPVERAVSNVLHLMRLDPAYAGMDFATAVQAAADPHLANLQTRYLSDATGPPGERDLDLALANLARIDMVGVTGQLLPFGSAVLAELAGGAVARFEERRNVAPNRDLVDPAAIDRLQALNFLDQRLYRAAERRCAAWLQDGPGKAAGAGDGAGRGPANPRTTQP